MFEDLSGVIKDDEDSDNESKQNGEIKDDRVVFIQMLVDGYGWRTSNTSDDVKKLIIEYIDEELKENIYIDHVGDIEGKLNRNNLRYYKFSQIPDKDHCHVNSKNFKIAYNKFKDKFQNEQDYPHRKRWVIMIDTQPDDQPCYFYEPPSNCRDIPKDAVPEWGMSASRTSLLPNKEYDAERAEYTPLFPAGDKNPAKMINENSYFFQSFLFTHIF